VAAHGTRLAGTTSQRSVRPRRQVSNRESGRPRHRGPPNFNAETSSGAALADFPAATTSTRPATRASRVDGTATASAVTDEVTEERDGRGGGPGFALNLSLLPQARARPAAGLKCAFHISKLGTRYDSKGGTGRVSAGRAPLTIARPIKPRPTRIATKGLFESGARPSRALHRVELGGASRLF
jgi:hypothetical protein